MQTARRCPFETALPHSRQRSVACNSARKRTTPKDTSKGPLVQLLTGQRKWLGLVVHLQRLNDVLSLGQHHVWKRMAVKWSRAAPGHSALDVCCGSGDLSFYLAEAVGTGGKVTGLDFSAEMLNDANRRTVKLRQRRGGSRKRSPPAMDWVQGDAAALPFADSSFDAATMGYGLRNVADKPAALRELRRVLKPGSKCAILDFNNSEHPLVDRFQSWALATVVVPLARSYGVSEEYEYLRPSIQRFPTGRQQMSLAKAAGFSKAVFYEIGFGLMGVLVVTK